MTTAANVPVIAHCYTEEELDAIRSTIKSYVDGDEDNCTVGDRTETADVIGCKLTALIIRHVIEQALDQCIIDGYYKRPPHLFYTDKAGNSIRRIYGICEFKDGTMGAHTVSAMIMVNNDVLGGIPLDELIPVKRWSESQLEFLDSELVSRADIFKKPLGFLELAR